jgi:hypothetical protein
MFTRKLFRHPRKRKFQNQAMQEKSLQQYGGSNSYLPDLGINNMLTNFFVWLAKCSK